MNGHIIPNSNIAVDLWKIRGQPTKYIHFLTHTHGDHIVGLTSTWHQPIFCSEVTAMLLIERHGVSKKLLNILPINNSVIIEVSELECFTVTTYDANHCPGAVMFYFEGEFGNVLYTGDFRLNDDILQICQNLSQKVDLLYLDNTFCSPDCVFPSREECLNQIVDIIRQHPNHKVIIGVRKLGKEILLGQLGVALNETICVSQDCYTLCKTLFSTDVFTTFSLSKNIIRLSTIPMSTIKFVGDRLAELNKITPTIAIIPTALFTGCPSRIYYPNIFVVPYSDHSSYAELHKFVAALKPSRVMPIVTYTRGPLGKDPSDRLNMSCFDGYLSSPRLCHVKANQTAHRVRNKYRANTPVGGTKRKSACANEGVRKKAKGVVYAEEDAQINGPAPVSESMIIDLSSDSEYSERDETDTSEPDENVIAGNSRGAAVKEMAVNTDSCSPDLTLEQLRDEGHRKVETGSSLEKVSNIDTDSNIDIDSNIDTSSSDSPKKTTASSLLNCIERQEKEIEFESNYSSVLAMDEAHLRLLITSAVCSALLPLETICDRTDHKDESNKSKADASDPQNYGCVTLLSCSEDNGCLNRNLKCSDKPNVLNTVSAVGTKRFAHSTLKTGMAEGEKVWSKSSCTQQSIDKQPHSCCSSEDSSLIRNMQASKKNLSVSEERQSTPVYNVEFCLDCFRKRFNLTSIETKDKHCLVCEKSFIGSKVIVDKLFVKVLKDKFSL